MSSSTKSNTRLILEDVVTVALFAVYMKLTSGYVHWSVLLDKDLFGVAISVILAVSVTAYAGFVYAVHKPKVVRFRQSAQFKNVLKILLAYMLWVPVVYIAQKLLNNFGLLALASAFVATYRMVWIYWKTLSLT